MWQRLYTVAGGRKGSAGRSPAEVARREWETTMTEPIRANQNSWSSRFWQEFRLVPRWLVWTMSLLLVASQINNFLVNRWAFQHGGEIFLPQLRNTPWLSSLALAGFAAV